MRATMLISPSCVPLVLVTFSLIITTARAEYYTLCDVTLQENTTKCIMFTPYLTTWTNAEGFCQIFGGHLVTIDNKEKDLYINTFIRTLKENPDRYSQFAETFWIGLNDRLLPSIFEWSSGILMNYSHWKNTIADWNPQNDTGSCAFLDFPNEWSISNCSVERQFICEQFPRNHNFGDCDNQGLRYRDSCYWAVDIDDGWYTASNWCRTKGGELVDIQDDLENAFVFNFFLKPGNPAWIGLRKTNNASYPIWSNGKISSYTNWDSFPNLSLELCAVMERQGKWMMQPCNAKITWAVCKKPVKSNVIEAAIGISTPVAIHEYANQQCSMGWTVMGSYCYMVEKSNKQSWDEAFNFCLSVGGNLASFESTDDEQNYFNGLQSNDTLDFWIGLKCSNGTINGMWVGGMPRQYNLQDPGLRRWGQGELCVVHSTEPVVRWVCLPCGAQAAFVCVMPVTAQEDLPGLSAVTDSITGSTSFSQASTGFWNGGGCDGTDSELCRQISNEDHLQDPSTLADGEPCPTAWDKLGRKCYKVQHEDLKDWASARRDCLSYGDGDLVAVHSAVEEEFLLEILSMRGVTDAWIGLNDLKSKDAFEWSDQSPMDYTRFSDSEQGNQQVDCVKITNDNWQMADCTNKISYICQTGLLTEMIHPKTSADTPDVDMYDTNRDTSLFSTSDSSIMIDFETGEDAASSPVIPQVNIDQQDVDIPNDLNPTYEDIIQDSYTSTNSEVSRLYGISPNDELKTCKCETDAGMSGGTIAGIVLGTLIITALIVGGILYAYRKRLTLELMKGKLSFDNALYNPHGDHIQLRDPAEVSVIS